MQINDISNSYKDDIKKFINEVKRHYKLDEVHIFGDTELALVSEDFSVTENEKDKIQKFVDAADMSSVMPKEMLSKSVILMDYKNDLREIMEHECSHYLLFYPIKTSEFKLGTSAFIDDIINNGVKIL